MCLSMHQPWASLLVLGIKRFEGRGWASSYRGPLWIASTARETNEEEIKELEAEYQTVYGKDVKVPFPALYPRSALLGRVQLVEVLSQPQFQRYRADHSESENSISMFVFICSQPHLLPLPLSITGQHKLWKLPETLFHNVREAVKPVSEKWRTGEKKRTPIEQRKGAQQQKRKTLLVKGPRLANQP